MLKISEWVEKMSKTQTRDQFRHASAGTYSAQNLKYKLNLLLTTRRVQQILSLSENIDYEKMKCAPALI